MTTTDIPTRRTKRRYAHELYPHPDEYEIRDLTVELPYLYAQFVGWQTWGTDWAKDRTRAGLLAGMQRIDKHRTTAQVALLADALHQGLIGQEAWEWVEERLTDELDIPFERAEHYGVLVDRIKPYEHNDELDHHDHYSEPDAHGWRTGTRIDGRESECPDCTEPTT